MSHQLSSGKKTLFAGKCVNFVNRLKKYLQILCVSLDKTI